VVVSIVPLDAEGLFIAQSQRAVVDIEDDPFGLAHVQSCVRGLLVDGHHVEETDYVRGITYANCGVICEGSYLENLVTDLDSLNFVTEMSEEWFEGDVVEER